jgi:protein gp37
MTAIEWTDETWNPVTGCDRVSPGCDHCYALTLAKRLKGMGQAKYQRDGDPRTSGPGFGLTVHPDVLDQPLRWRKPRRVFVNSMSDLFHPAVPAGFIAEVWDRMGATPQHTYQVLTKRPQRMATVMQRMADGTYLNTDGLIDSHPGAVDALPLFNAWPLPNVWLGTSIESDRYAFRADHLRNTPAAVRFLSLEPLLGPLPSLDLTGIDWVIVGGESGPGARPMHPDWVLDIRDRCQAAGVAFFFKQWGNWAESPDLTPRNGDRLVHAGTTAEEREYERAIYMRNVGKKAAGRELDGRTWDEMPGGAR